MDPHHYAAPAFGTPRREPGNRTAFWYFLPEKIPREVSLASQTVLALSSADSALGLLQGLGHLIRDPELLVGPYLTREAVASSRIEGAQASLGDVLQAEASNGPSRNEDVLEVERYIAATRKGLDLIGQLPLTQRLVKDVHAVLLSGVRGKERLPGEFRRSPVWVGSPTNSPDTALFVPPLHDDIGELFHDWEVFVNEDAGALPPLVSCALMHYQFETIHPFLDGNGRIGRLLIGLMLTQLGRLTTPLLYISGYLEANRREYYERLQAVRERGELQEWLQFFFTAVEKQAADAVTRAQQLVAARETYLAAAAKSRSRLGVIIDLAFQNPFLTVQRVELATELTNQGARNLIKAAEQRGWLTELGRGGRGGKTYWLADDVWTVINSPTAYERQPDGR